MNESQEQEGLCAKRLNYLSMMIIDSFANDLCDKVISASTELARNTGKRQGRDAIPQNGIELMASP